MKTPPTPAPIAPAPPPLFLGAALHMFISAPGVGGSSVAGELSRLTAPWHALTDFERNRLDELARDLAAYLGAASAGTIATHLPG